MIEIARVMRNRSCAATFAGSVKEILGTCVSVGCTVEHEDPRDIQQKVGSEGWGEVFVFAGVGGERAQGQLVGGVAGTCQVGLAGSLPAGLDSACGFESELAALLRALRRSTTARWRCPRSEQLASAASLCAAPPGCAAMTQQRQLGAGVSGRGGMAGSGGAAPRRPRGRAARGTRGGPAVQRACTAAGPLL